MIDREDSTTKVWRSEVIKTFTLLRQIDDAIGYKNADYNNMLITSLPSIAVVYLQGEKEGEKEREEWVS